MDFHLIHVISMDNKSMIYGHWHFGIKFIKKIEIVDSGFIFKNKEYEWEEVEKVCMFKFPRMPFVWFAIPFQSIIRIYLNDKRKIQLQSRVFGTEDQRPKAGFWNGITTEFSKFEELIKNQVGNDRIKIFS